MLLVCIKKKNTIWVMQAGLNSSVYNAEGELERQQNFYRISILIAFDLIWKVLLSDKNFANILDPSLQGANLKILHSIGYLSWIACGPEDFLGSLTAVFRGSTVSHPVITKSRSMSKFG